MVSKFKKDILNIEMFKTADGKNYRQAEELDIEPITKHLSELGYRVLDLEQPWRYLHGRLEKDDQVFFFKMASTEDIGERTQNEVSWNEQISKVVEEYEIDFFDVPKIFKTDKLNNRFYYISEYYDGELLASANPPDTKDLNKWLDKIIKTNLFLLELKNIDFLRDKKQRPLTERWNGYFNKVSKWHEAVKENNLDDVLEKVKDLKKTYEPGINHGDFVPWHMKKEKDKFILIDSEHASSKSPRYYDVVYFYHRLFTSANDPDLAKKYLNKIENNLQPKEKDKFIIAIKPILASRIIGGFWDATTDGLNDLSYHNRLRDDFLNNEIS